MLLEPTFIASAVVATMRMRRQGHVAHGTSIGYIPRCRSLRYLHNRGPKARGCVNRVETEPRCITDLCCTSVYNLYLHSNIGDIKPRTQSVMIQCNGKLISYKFVYTESHHTQIELLGH